MQKHKLESHEQFFTSARELICKPSTFHLKSLYLILQKLKFSQTNLLKKKEEKKELSVWLDYIELNT